MNLRMLALGIALIVGSIIAIVIVLREMWNRLSAVEAQVRAATHSLKISETALQGAIDNQLGGSGHTADAATLAQKKEQQ